MRACDYVIPKGRNAGRTLGEVARSASGLKGLERECRSAFVCDHLPEYHAALETFLASRPEPLAPTEAKLRSLLARRDAIALSTR